MFYRKKTINHGFLKDNWQGFDESFFLTILSKDLETKIFFESFPKIFQRILFKDLENMF